MISAILFGGPLDGQIKNLPCFALELRHPVKRRLGYFEEGESLHHNLYDEVIYDYEMHANESEALYIYRENRRQ